MTMLFCVSESAPFGAPGGGSTCPVNEPRPVIFRLSRPARRAQGDEPALLHAWPGGGPFPGGAQGKGMQPQNSASETVSSKWCAVGESVAQLGNCLSGTVSPSESYVYCV